MGLQTFLANEVIKIQVNLQLSYLEVTWLIHPESATFREFISQAAAISQEYGLTKWLCNMHQADFLEVVDQHWLVETVFTRFNAQVEHDFAYFIRPMVLEVLTTCHIQHLVEENQAVNKKVRLGIFTDLDQAKEWLFAPKNYKMAFPFYD